MEPNNETPNLAVYWKTLKINADRLSELLEQIEKKRHTETLPQKDGEPIPRLVPGFHVAWLSTVRTLAALLKVSDIYTGHLDPDGVNYPSLGDGRYWLTKATETRPLLSHADRLISDMDKLGWKGITE